MKISEMNNDQAADAMIKLAGPISRLLEDEETRKLVEEAQSQREGESGIAFFGRILPKFVPFAMKDHREDLYAVIAALTLQPVSAIGKMNFVQTIRELRESIDEDFLGFFK